MHIADGIIDTNICVAAHVISGGMIYLSGKNTQLDDIPKMGMMGAALFVASLIHFPFAGTSVHLGLFGIAGIILGKRAFPAIFTALLFQSLIFQHGGLLTLGVNSLNMGAGALVAWLIWRVKKVPEFLRAILAGFFGIMIPAVLMALEFRLSGYGRGIMFLFSVYLVAAAIESAITFSAVKLLRRVKPEILT
ncbi:MAG: CbiM family transporter [Bacteroidales bacterium]